MQNGHCETESALHREVVQVCDIISSMVMIDYLKLSQSDGRSEMFKNIFSSPTEYEEYSQPKTYFIWMVCV